MTEDEFWNIIELTRSDTQNDQIAKLTSQLQQRQAEQIIAFQNIYDIIHEKAGRTNLAAAANLINDGISDDGFDYFRDWLIAQGRKIYEAALTNPDSLADVILSDNIAFEDFKSVAYDVYQAKCNADLDEALNDHAHHSRDDDEVNDVSGLSENELESQFPRLFDVVNRIRADRPLGWFEKLTSWVQCLRGKPMD